MNLKLYVWEDVLCDYTCGVMFALASSVEEAREVILSNGNYDSVREDLKKEPQVFESLVGFAVWGGS